MLEMERALEEMKRRGERRKRDAARCEASEKAQLRDANATYMRLADWATAGTEAGFIGGRR
jgi:hypothetical protein